MGTSKVEAAKARALISQVLSADPGKEFTTGEVATVIGLNQRTTGQILGGMARGNLIMSNGVTGKGKRWSWPEDAPPSEAPTRRKYSKRGSNIAAAKEIELSMAGIQIVVGRNPATGRLRIILEET